LYLVLTSMTSWIHNSFCLPRTSLVAHKIVLYIKAVSRENVKLKIFQKTCFNYWTKFTYSTQNIICVWQDGFSYTGLEVQPALSFDRATLPFFSGIPALFKLKS